ncbi:MAG: hypothetical protein MET45_16200 [Nostoc sp. LLA-1]|nr:hypothetical protein [Cyanocohniella sp. LLY]
MTFLNIWFSHSLHDNSYQRDNWRAGINIQNLLKEKYFQGANVGRVAIEPGAPLTVIGSFSVTF